MPSNTSFARLSDGASLVTYKSTIGESSAGAPMNNAHNRYVERSKALQITAGGGVIDVHERQLVTQIHKHPIRKPTG